MDKLLPCPFCGGEANLKKISEIVGHGMTTTLYFVECCDCKSRGTSFDSWLDGHRNIEDRAIKAWETRTKERGGENG